MRFRPSDRISISQALDMVNSISGSANTDEEAEDGMDEAKDEMDEAEDGMDDRGLSTLSNVRSSVLPRRRCPQAVLDVKDIARAPGDAETLEQHAMWRIATCVSLRLTQELRWRRAASPSARSGDELGADSLPVHSSRLHKFWRSKTSGSLTRPLSRVVQREQQRRSRNGSAKYDP